MTKGFDIHSTTYLHDFWNYMGFLEDFRFEVLLFSDINNTVDGISKNLSIYNILYHKSNSVGEELYLFGKIIINCNLFSFIKNILTISFEV